MSMMMQALSGLQDLGPILKAFLNCYRQNLSTTLKADMSNTLTFSRALQTFCSEVGLQPPQIEHLLGHAGGNGKALFQRIGALVRYHRKAKKLSFPIWVGMPRFRALEPYLESSRIRDSPAKQAFVKLIEAGAFSAPELSAAAVGRSYSGALGSRMLDC